MLIEFGEAPDQVLPGGTMGVVLLQAFNPFCIDHTPNIHIKVVFCFFQHSNIGTVTQAEQIPAQEAYIVGASGLWRCQLPV